MCILINRHRSVSVRNRPGADVDELPLPLIQIHRAATGNDFVGGRCVAGVFSAGHRHVAHVRRTGGRRVGGRGHRHLHAGHGLVHFRRAAVIGMRCGWLHVRAAVVRMSGLAGLFAATDGHDCQDGNRHSGDYAAQD